jgi:hypothetical protein
MVTTQEDDFTFEKARWLAHLSNGEIVIQDDGRPNVDPPQAWLRLSDYCRQNNLNIVKLTLQFRSHIEDPLPENAEGYFFVNKIATVQGGPQINFFMVGHLEGEQVHIQQWKLPELILCGYETRSVDKIGLSLIRNNQ